MAKVNPVNNKEKGRAGERRATAVIGLALCAQGIAASLEEEDAKVDIKFSYKNSIDNVQENHNCQVKTGSSFGEFNNNRTKIKLKQISNDTKVQLKNSASILVWIPNKPSPKIYWTILDARKDGIPSPIKFPSHQYVRPSILIDFSRHRIYLRHAQNIIRHTLPQKALNNNDTAKRAFKLIANKVYKNPLIGQITVSNYTWRHITRPSKTDKKRLRTFEIISVLDKFLEQCPSRFLIKEPTLKVEGKVINETRRIKLWYRKAIIKNGTEYTLVLKLKEKISYPKDWLRFYLTKDDISNLIILESWWLIR